jgi:hypothetical protein
LRGFGASVIVDGICAGACTLVLSYIPHDRMCVTSRAVFGFRVADNPALPISKVREAKRARPVPADADFRGTRRKLHAL